MDTYKKKYKEALERAKNIHKDAINMGENIRVKQCEIIFPELKDNEDERIRKELIEYIKDQQSSFISAPDCRDKYEEEENNKYNSWIAWLEKQGTSYTKRDVDNAYVGSMAFAKNELEKQGEKNSITTEEYEKTREQVAYAIRQLHVCECTKNRLLAWLEKQSEPKPYGQRQEYADCQFNYAGECKGSCTMKRDEQKPIIEMKSPKEDLGISSKEYNEIVNECIFGEWESSNNAEPKFKVGDWISGYYTSYQVLSINNEGYVVEDVDGNKINILFENEKFHHLWTIEDAKDGDVLMSRSPFIYGKQCPYGGLDWYNNNFIKASNFIFTDSPVHPATKEQRNLLFQKIHEAGYMWDSENKQLLSLRAEPSNEQKSTWSEKDNKWIENLIQTFEDGYLEGFNQLKSYGVISWLKSIKERYIWKPSNEQMDALNTCLIKGEISYVGQGSILQSLYDKLKTL